MFLSKKVVFDDDLRKPLNLKMVTRQQLEGIFD